jgi:hypothetical protein
MLELTPEIQKKIEGFVRAGATPLSAAKAAGVDADSYAEWMELADSDSPLYKEFRRTIDAAEGEGRAAAEIELRRKSPKSWLRPKETAIAPAPRGPHLSSRKRDQQRRRKVTALVRLSGREDPKYRPGFQLAAEILLVKERVYLSLKDRELINPDGSAIGAVESFRRLCDSEASLLKALGLMPTSLLPDDRAGSLDAVFSRIEKVRAQRGSGNAEQNSPA